MSGHSKWAKIHRQKGAADAKRGNLFTKLSKNISVAARNGGDPDMNFSLKLAVDRAKSSNMPKDKIENAIKRGTGEMGGAVIEEVVYEAYGPNGIPLIIEGVTDNKNRTTPEVKAILGKNGGSLGAQNSVQWMFERQGVIYIANDKITDKDELTLELIDCGAADVVDEEGGLAVYTSFSDFEKVKKELEIKNIQPEEAQIEWVAKDKVTAEEEIQNRIDRIVDLLEEHDDVNSVFTNLE
jgi:YebC/PmpR family DNA-binding regulatory protein